MADSDDESSVPEGWTRKVVQRQSGTSAGQFDVYIFSPAGKKFRSLKEVERFLEKEGITDISTSDFKFKRPSKATSSTVKAKTPKASKKTSSKENGHDKSTPKSKGKKEKENKTDEKRGKDGKLLVKLKFLKSEKAKGNYNIVEAEEQEGCKRKKHGSKKWRKTEGTKKISLKRKIAENEKSPSPKKKMKQDERKENYVDVESGGEMVVDEEEFQEDDDGDDEEPKDGPTTKKERKDVKKVKSDKDETPNKKKAKKRSQEKSDGKVKTASNASAMEKGDGGGLSDTMDEKKGDVDTSPKKKVKGGSEKKKAKIVDSMGELFKPDIPTVVLTQMPTKAELDPVSISTPESHLPLMTDSPLKSEKKHRKSALTFYENLAKSHIKSPKPKDDHSSKPKHSNKRGRPSKHHHSSDRSESSAHESSSKSEFRKKKKKRHDNEHGERYSQDKYNAMPYTDISGGQMNPESSDRISERVGDNVIDEHSIITKCPPQRGRKKKIRPSDQDFGSIAPLGSPTKEEHYTGTLHTSNELEFIITTSEVSPGKSRDVVLTDHCYAIDLAAKAKPTPPTVSDSCVLTQSESYTFSESDLTVTKDFSAEESWNTSYDDLQDLRDQPLDTLESCEGKITLSNL